MSVSKRFLFLSKLAIPQGCMDVLKTSQLVSPKVSNPRRVPVKIYNAFYDLGLKSHTQSLLPYSICYQLFDPVHIQGERNRSHFLKREMSSNLRTYFKISTLKNAVTSSICTSLTWYEISASKKNPNPSKTWQSAFCLSTQDTLQDLQWYLNTGTKSYIYCFFLWINTYNKVYEVHTVRD